MELPRTVFRTRRVMQVITPSHMSGAEMQLVRLTKQMQARGHEFSTVIKRQCSATAEMRRLGVEAEPLAIGGKLNVLAIHVLAQQMRRTRPDIIQSTLSTASWWCGWLERLSGRPTIGHVQGFTSARWHRQQSHLLAVSQAVKDDLVAQGIAADKITVLHNALGPEEFVARRDPRDIRDEFGATAETPVIGTIAHLSEKKGHRDLFAAMPDVCRAFPKVQFWIIGRGQLRDELEATARRNGTINHVRFLGFRRDMADLMNAIDMMALPSHREPCALVYIEAALMRKPILACRAGGAPESVADGETGLLVPVRDSAAIADSLCTLLENRSRAHAMGQAGYERARDLFGWPRFIRTLEGVYDRVLDGEVAAPALPERRAA
ncbi:MAG: glycosyltransferase family 4 protein [Pirellulales bacterium]